MQITKEKYHNILINSFTQIMQVMFKESIVDDIKIIPGLPLEEKREVALVIHFTGGLNGKIILSCSFNTALKISKKISGCKQETEIKPKEQKQFLKDNLGELINMLSGKIVYIFQKEYGTTRITTPTIIIGSKLIVSIYSEKSIYTYLELPFGKIELTLTLN